MSSFEVSQGTGSAPMDLSEVSPGISNGTGDQRAIAEVREQVAQLCAFVKGSGKGGSGSGSWNSYNSNSASKGKGKGKGKGPTAPNIAFRRAEKVPGAVPVCAEYQRTGKCTYFARTGRECKFKHVKDLPAALSSVEGLISTDLPPLAKSAAWDEDSHCFVVAPAGGGELPTPIANIEAEIGQISGEIEAEMGFEFPAEPPAGFQRHLG